MGAWLCVGGIAYSAFLSPGDREFMSSAARLNMIGAHESQIAEDQASMADIEDLAKTLVQNHSRDYGRRAELTSISQKMRNDIIFWLRT